MNETKITVLLPTYNRVALLPRAIRCITEQTFSAWRLLVINDGGEDVSGLVRSFNDSRIEYIPLPHQGKAAALNFGLSMVHSKYVSYMDDDDEVFPRHLEKLYCFAENTNSEFVYSDTYITVLDARNRAVARFVENDKDVFYEDLRLHNSINHKQIMHTATLAEKIGGYDTKMAVLVDYDFIKRLAAEVVPSHLPEVTGNHFLYSSTSEQISSLWIRDPETAGKSLLSFFQKDPAALAYLYSNDLPVRRELSEIKNCVTFKLLKYLLLPEIVIRKLVIIWKYFGIKGIIEKIISKSTSKTK